MRDLLRKKAVILLSGGLDSAVTLFLAVREGCRCYCLTFDYGQRHKKEIEFSRKLAEKTGSEIKIMKLDFSWKGSSLTDKSKKLPAGRSIEEIKKEIPSTYVPARNTVFLSMAASYAEAIGAQEIFIGAHFEDSSGYPDCRKEYLESFEKTLQLGTKAGMEGKLKLRFPLIDMAKKEIISLGLSLGVPLDITWSCYEGDEEPCGVCDACVLRNKGFNEK